MDRFAVWLFIGWARPALFLLTCAIAVEVVWRHASRGWAACLGMLLLALFVFLKALDRIANTTEEERQARKACTRARRARNTAFWRRQLEAKRAREKEQA